MLASASTALLKPMARMGSSTWMVLGRMCRKMIRMWLAPMSRAEAT